MFSTLKRNLGGALSAAAIFIGSSTAGALAEDVSFEGETVELWVPFDTGGGTDRFARLFPPFLHKYLPGNPDVVVFNKPGGAAVTGSNEFDSHATKDGKVVMAASMSVFLAYMLGVDQVKYDPSDWRAILSAPVGGAFYANPRTTGATGEDVIADVNKLQSRPVLIGMQSPRSAHIRSYLLLRMLGFDIKPVLGLGTSAQRQAVLRGELDIGQESTGTFVKTITPYIEKGEVVPLFSYGFGPELGKDPAMPDLPSFLEVYQSLNGTMPSGVEWEGTKAALSVGIEAGRALVLPEGTPDEILEVYEEALKKTLADPEFQKIAAVDIGHNPLTGAEALESVKRVTTISDEARAWLAQMLHDDFGID